jgi:hypothetical protein
MAVTALDENAGQKLAQPREEMKKHGHDRAKFGTDGWLTMHEAGPQGWAAADGWRQAVGSPLRVPGRIANRTEL